MDWTKFHGFCKHFEFGIVIAAYIILFNFIMNRTILIFLIALAIAGRKKAKTTVERTTATYDFSWTDVPLSGVPTYADLHKFAFVTTAPVGSTTMPTLQTDRG